MTWQELADFINNQMPKNERNKDVVVWDASMNNVSGGNFMSVIDCSSYDGREPIDYSLAINTEDWFKEL